MANSFDSNFTRPLARVFLKAFETERVMTKNVNTQLLENKFNPASGTQVDFKRPTDYKTKRTATGDITGIGRSDIITGKATGTVQNYFTVDIDYNEVDQALKMDQLEELLAPAARRIVTDLEVDFANYAVKNTGLLAGTYGTAATTWDHVALGGATLQSHGVPMDEEWAYFVNPYTQAKLASNQRSLGAVDPLVRSAHEMATISKNFAGMSVMTATALPAVTHSAGADRAGTLSANPTVTYLAHKDSMQQTLAVTGFQANLVVKAGEVVQIAGRNRLNLSTRQAVIDSAGAKVLWTGTVVSDVTLGAAGEGNLVVTGPAIFEAAGAYNTVDTAPISGDVITLLGTASSFNQPNLFWHKQAFGLGFVKLQKLYSTDTVATTEDGISIRVSRYANGDANKQIVRFDMLPAYATFNPFFAGQGFGAP